MNYSTFLTKYVQFAFTKGLCGLITFGLSLPAWAGDFGVADWGMTPEEVRLLETRSNLTPFDAKGYLIYELVMTGIDRSRIVYQFNGNQLTEGRFLFYTNNPLDVQSAVDNYETIKTTLSAQYGPPNEDKILRSDPTVGNIMAQDIANELSSDRVILKSSWSAPNAIIYHQLAWNDTKPHHQLHYVPLQMMDDPVSSEGF